MSKIDRNKFLKCSYIIVSLIVVIALFVNISVNFVRAWFTDSVTDYGDGKVAQVDIRILENGTEIGGKAEIEHNDPFDLSDDVYKFTPGKTPVCNTPVIGSSVTLNLQVKNVGWAGGLVRILGFAITGVEENPGGNNDIVVFESDVSISNNNEAWVLKKHFDYGMPEATVIAYDMYLNRVLEENETADVAITLTNNNLDIIATPKLTITFYAEITVYESNAYKTNGDNPPFGRLNDLPSEWVAWQ